MASAAGNQNSSAQESKIPIPRPNGHARAVREDSSVSSVKKPPFETRKSAEELKSRLASAVSAKIASSKDGRSPSSNRGIGYLLQRKEQQENRLNTKAISFQKPARNGNGKIEMEAKDTNTSGKSLRNSMSKAELQKSLLSALMNSRTPGAISGQNKNTRPAFGSKLDSSTTIKEKTDTQNEPIKKPLVTPNTNENEAKSGTGGRGKVDKERVKNLEILLGRRKQVNNVSAAPTIAKNDVVLHGRDKNSESRDGTSISNAKKEENFKLNKTTAATKPTENAEKDATADLNGKNNGNVSLNKIDGTIKLFETTRKEKSTISSADVNSNENEMSMKLATFKRVENSRADGTATTGDVKFSQSKTLSSSKPFEKVGKKLPPPVAKKPTKNNVQKAKQDTLPLGINGKESLPKTSSSSIAKASSEIHKKIATASSSPQIQRNGNALGVNGTISGKEKEDLLEKLEASVGSCKIAAFQSMEDFSALRMKVYRIRGELDQLKRDREKRTPLLC